MAGLRYVGRYPDSDGILVHKASVDDRWAAVRVDNAYIDAQAGATAADLSTQSYVDAQDAPLAKKTYVDTRDQLYVSTTSRGANNGVAPLDLNSYLPAIHHPLTLATERPMTVVHASGPDIKFSGTRVVTSAANPKEFLAAQVTIADPGYPYVPVAMGQVSGRLDGTAVEPAPGLSTGVYGQAIVFDAANATYARAVTSGNRRTADSPLMPWAISGQTPVNVTGPLVLSLYLSLFGTPGGTTPGYAFTSARMSFYVLIFSGV